MLKIPLKNKKLNRNMLLHCVDQSINQSISSDMSKTHEEKSHLSGIQRDKILHDIISSGTVTCVAHISYYPGK